MAGDAIRSLSLRIERLRYKAPFRIAGHVFEESAVLVAEIRDGDHRGRGEGAGVYYLGDDAPHMLAEAESARAAIEAGADREALQTLLPAGGARNALDCAMWDLEASQTATPVWKLAGMAQFDALKTTITIGADTPEAMAASAAGRLGVWPVLKLKLTGDSLLDAERVHAVREARGDAWIGVDANQGYTPENLSDLVAVLKQCRVALLEQPLARGNEAALDGVERPLPFAADESVCTLAELDRAVGRFDVINIKLDKCGGLTEGLAIALRCKALGLAVMVGNMMGSSWSMAPSLILGQLCEVVDLDGPTFLATDRAGGVQYRPGGYVTLGAGVWGGLATTEPSPKSSD